MKTEYIKPEISIDTIATENVMASTSVGVSETEKDGSTFNARGSSVIDDFWEDE